jgi:biopolymer transport protein ExbD
MIYIMVGKPDETGVIDKVKSQTSTYRVAERMREYYVDDVFGVMKDADATYEDFVMIRDALKWSGRCHIRIKKVG